MKISLDHATASYRIRSYGSGHVVVDETRYTSPLIVLPEQLITDWQPGTVDDLGVEGFAALFEREPEILLLGTGTNQIFPPAKLMADLAARGTGLEVMDTPAACRTYNILMAEDRHVAAALFMMD